ncbi:MAG: hypothetical protein ISS57_01255 [Anaerolineales bacterium]|nr:hypothetical protein [Anaerolineales bacterium]
MRTWNLTANDPGAYTIAADARCGPTDYANDHIWELSLAGGEPPALALKTTYGLRARNLRLFPRFVEGDTAVSDPENFVEQPSVQRFYPNYLALTCSPYTGIDVSLEYWVPESQVIAGRVRIKNSRLSARQLCFEWGAMLSAATEGERMAPQEMEAVTVLCGQTDGLAPVLFMTGGPQFGSGPFPALAIDIELPTGGERIYTWVMVSLENHEESFAAARSIAARPWEKEIARLDVLNAGLIDIETGDPDWDAAFALTQKNAFGLLVGPTDQLPQTSYVISRQPDHGHSSSGDGSDHAYLWSGQTPLETDFLVSMMLPAAPKIAAGLLANFLSIQKQSGFIDWKPGLAGQRGGVMATPILAHLAWKIYQATEDRQFLDLIYPNLLKAVQAWFDSAQDRDGDGIPEWNHLMQSGLDEHPIFSPWQEWSQGADISQSESPALCALLYNEIQTLVKMAHVLERTGSIPSLVSLGDNLVSAIEASWDESASMYRVWDRETHLSPSREVLAEHYGPGEIFLQRSFDQPVRLLISITGIDTTPRQINLFIHGAGTSGQNRVERITEEQFPWRLRQSSATSQRVYAQLEYIEIRDIGPNDLVRVEVIGLACQDYSLFLPLCAGIPTQERADQIIRQALLDPDRYWRNFGLPVCPLQATEAETHPCANTSILWSSLLGKGLVNYGYRREAAELVNRLMTAIISNLKKHQAFAHSYNVETGAGVGERNALQGLAPLSLFLETLGVRLISPSKVALEGHNPFPWPVTIKYRGLTILREDKKTRVTFPGGQTAVVKNPDPHIVELDKLR